MSNESGLKSLKMGQNAWAKAEPGLAKGAGPEVSGDKDSQLQEAFHDRTYNPINSVPSRNVSSELNADSARYKKGPGPL